MILVFGTVCFDRVRRVPHMPHPGGYVEVVSEQTLLGGEAAITANALQRWGAEVVLAPNAIGSGSRSEELRSALHERGLDPYQGHMLDTSETPICDVFVSDDGERTMIGQGFSTLADSVDPELLPFEPGSWFTTDLNMGASAREALRLAGQAGMHTYAMDFVLDADVIPSGSFWQSSTDWTGKRGDSETNIQWLREWTLRHRCFGVLTDGPLGFYAGSHEIPIRAYAPYPLDRLVDATGAGDTFRAGMLFGLNQDWQLDRCLQFASAAGCLACRSLGATTHVPTVEEIQGLISANPAISATYSSDLATGKAVEALR